MSKVYRQLVLSVILATIVLLANAQQPDSTVWAEGKVINAATKQPIAARISYQSMPYGSRVGSSTGSSFSFPFLYGDKYSLVVQAEGYESAKFLLDPAEANADRKVLKDIELKVGAEPVKHPVGHVMRLDNLIFQQGRARISPESHTELDILVDMLRTHAKMVIQLEGHTDYLGPAKDNLALSQKRVDAVKDYLVTKGINKNRVKAKAFGGTKPLSRVDTPEAHTANRRVEVRVLEN